MEEIEVGEYVRDCDGFIVKVNEIQDYKEDDDVWYQEKTLKGTWKSMVVKHSPNIIDLIEVGDYVDGERMDIVDRDENGRVYYLQNIELPSVNKDEIKSIVTKEQFASMEYKVGE